MISRAELPVGTLVSFYLARCEAGCHTRRRKERLQGIERKTEPAGRRWLDQRLGRSVQHGADETHSSVK